MTSITKRILRAYLYLVDKHLWDDSMRRAVILVKYKESQRWVRSS